ncbi:MAG: hypothetical protein H7228_08945 [Polaromonas sp.]|nr:hypothetical protein [Polaromonas sp.]
MRRQKSLFDAPDPLESQAIPASTALVISGQRLAPEQKLFNQLLAKIEKSKETLQNLHLWVGEHRVQYAKRISPLEQQQQALQKQMVVFLDKRLQNSKGLSKPARAYMTQVICSLAGSMMSSPDGADMSAIYERYAPEDTPDTEADAAAAMQDMMADVFGLDLDDDEGLESPEQVMAAVMRKMQEQREQQASLDAAKKSRRKKTPKQLQAEREAIDADKVLRDIYRKLASALHPDREPDEQERQRKTALMVEVNVANEKKDLLALLQLQLKVEQIDPGTVSAMAQDKLRHFNRVLKEQAQSLKIELDHAQFMIQSEFDLSPYDEINPRSLELSLRYTVRTIKEIIDQMKQDLAQVQDDRGLKTWVKEQKALTDEEDNFNDDDFDAAEFEAFGAALAKAARSKR